MLTVFFCQVDAQLSEQVELFRLVDSEGLTLLHWAADRGQVLKFVHLKLLQNLCPFRLRWLCSCWTVIPYYWMQWMVKGRLHFTTLPLVLTLTL